MPELPEAQSLDLRQILRVLMRRKLLLVLPWGVALAAGVAAVLLLKPIYFSSVTLMLERPQNLSGPLSGMVGARNPEQQAEVMREQVQSSLFLRSVLTASGLKSEPATREWALRESQKYHGLPAEERLESFLVDYLREAITVRKSRGNIFQITVADGRPERAKRFAEAVANQFVVSSKAAQLEAVRATQEFSVEQQQIYKLKLEESEGRLEGYRRSVLTTSMSGSSVSETNASHARSLLEQAEIDVDEQSQYVTSISNQFAGRARPADAAQLSNPKVLALAGQLSSLERQLGSALLSQASGDGGGAVRQSIARKMSELEYTLGTSAAAAFPQMASEVRELLVRYRLAQADWNARQARRDFLNAQLASYEHRVVMAPDRELEIQRLTQEVENNRTLYNSFLQQSAAAQIAEAFENAKVSGRFEILEPATLPLSPGKPNRLMIIMLSVVLGGVVGIGSVLVAEQHDQSMRNTEEVESLLGLPVLGAVPRVDELERARRRPRAAASTSGGPGAHRDPGLLHRLKVESPLGLEFRRIYLKLAKSRGRSLPSTLLVTSSMRGEGKTTTTACLAITLARELKEKVLLVDFDLRSPAMHRALGLPSSTWGLAHMLQTRQFEDRLVRSTVLPNLDFLPAGKSERPAAELLDTDTVEWFVREARTHYPYVILDSAPTLAVPDPLILGRAVEGVIYVVRAGATVRKAAEYGVRVQREAKDNLLGVLLNDAGEILPHYYGYHDAYGYTPEAAGGESS